jgi:hypothetical protein
MGESEEEAVNKSFFTSVRHLWKADFLSPKDLVRRGIFLGLVYLLIHIAGLREFTSILSGTTGSVQVSWQISALLGMLYIFSYLSAVLLAPILVLSAILMYILDKTLLKKRRAEDA